MLDQELFTLLSYINSEIDYVMEETLNFLTIKVSGTQFLNRGKVLEIVILKLISVYIYVLHFSLASLFLPAFVPI